MCVCVCVCVRARVYACEHACVRVSIYMRARECAFRGRGGGGKVLESGVPYVYRAKIRADCALSGT